MFECVCVRVCVCPGAWCCFCSRALVACLKTGKSAARARFNSQTSLLLLSLIKVRQRQTSQPASQLSVQMLWPSPVGPQQGYNVDDDDDQAKRPQQQQQQQKSYSIRAPRRTDERATLIGQLGHRWPNASLVFSVVSPSSSSSPSLAVGGSATQSAYDVNFIVCIIMYTSRARNARADLCFIFPCVRALVA